MFRLAMQGFTEAFGPNDVRTIIVVNNLCDLYRHSGRHDEVDKLVQQGFQVWAERHEN
jgi:hypothetical protein